MTPTAVPFTLDKIPQELPGKFGPLTNMFTQIVDLRTKEDQTMYCPSSDDCVLKEDQTIALFCGCHRYYVMRNACNSKG